MTLKSLFFNLQKEDLKRRIWTIALLLLMFFLVLPVICALNLESFTYLDSRERITREIINYLGPQYFGATLIIIIAAIINGISGFFFLHSKRRVDFYHSIPVKRETLFAVNYVNGFLITFVTYIINLLMSIIVLAVNGYLCKEISYAIGMAVVINCIYFIMIYTIVVIAVMLTGNFIISCFASAVLLLYGPTLMLVKEEYYREFFTTYYPEIRLSNALLFLSPIGRYLEVARFWESGKNITTSLLVAAVVDIALIGFALLLYRKRSSDAAGKAMAFKISKAIVKFALVVLLSLGGGVLFLNIAKSSDGWFIFGLVFSLLITHSVIEIIYQFDIRAIFHHKGQLLLCGMAVAVIACCFRFDWLGFDSYLPDQEEIQSMSVAIDNIERNIDYFNLEEGRYISCNYIDFQLEHMVLTDYETAYALAEAGILSTDTNAGNESDGYYSYHVKYNLENGKTVYRKYKLNIEHSYRLLKKLYESKEFKLAHYPLYQCDIKNVGKVSLKYYNYIMNDQEFGLDGKESYSLALNSEAKKEFLSTYEEDLSTLTLDELRYSEPLFSVQVEVGTYDDGSYHSVIYYVYPSFTKTLSLISDKGMAIPEPIRPEDIKYINVIDYRPVYQTVAVDGIYSTAATKASCKEAVIKNQEQIAEILPGLVQRDYYNNNRALIETEEFLDVILFVYNVNYNGDLRYSYVFRQDTIPDFIQDELKPMD